MGIPIETTEIENSTSPRTSILANQEAEKEYPIHPIHNNSTDGRSCSPKQTLAGLDMVEAESGMDMDCTHSCGRDSSQPLDGDVKAADRHESDIEARHERLKSDIDSTEASSLRVEELDVSISSLQVAEASDEQPSLVCVCCGDTCRGSMLFVPTACTCASGSRYCVDCMRQWITTELDAQVLISTSC